MEAVPWGARQSRGFSALAGVVSATLADFLADGPAPAWPVGIGTGLGRHFPARHFRRCGHRCCRLRGELNCRRFAIFPGPAAKETHDVMVDRPRAVSSLLGADAAEYRRN